MNMHLPIFTEVLGYNKNIEQLDKIIKAQREKEGLDEQEQIEEVLNQRGYESDEDDDIEEPQGIKGMTLQLLELLTTLVQRPNVQEVVKQGINPLLMTVSSYMIIEFNDQREYHQDQNYFLHDKTQSVFKLRTIRN